MVKKLLHINFSAVAVLFIILQVAGAREPISYEEFLESYEDAMKSAMGTDLKISNLPPEVEYFIVDLYEDNILGDYPTAKKKDVTKILANDLKSRTTYYKQNRAIFKSFILKVMEADIKNYPDENSGVNVLEMNFLSLMTMETVVGIMKDIIAKRNAPVDDSWKILNLRDAFRTVYFYCKYPKEMAPYITEEMRVEVRDWLDSVATWGKWGFDDEDASINLPLNNDSTVKVEL